MKADEFDALRRARRRRNVPISQAPAGCVVGVLAIGIILFALATVVQAALWYRIT